VAEGGDPDVAVGVFPETNTCERGRLRMRHVRKADQDGLVPVGGAEISKDQARLTAQTARPPGSRLRSRGAVRCRQRSSRTRVEPPALPPGKTAGKQSSVHRETIPGR